MPLSWIQKPCSITLWLWQPTTKQSSLHNPKDAIRELHSPNQRPALTRNDQWEARNYLLSEQNSFFVNQGMHKTNQRTIAETLAKQKWHDINMRNMFFSILPDFFLCAKLITLYIFRSSKVGREATPWGQKYGSGKMQYSVKMIRRF